MIENGPVYEHALRTFVANYGCKSGKHLDNPSACEGCQADFDALLDTVAPLFGAKPRGEDAA